MFFALLRVGRWWGVCVPVLASRFWVRHASPSFSLFLLPNLSCAMSGQRTPTNPQTALAMLVAKREKLLEDLRQVEKQVYDLETTYLHDSSQTGNVLKGFEGFLSSTKGAGNLKRPRKFQPEDRLFSLSSMTSPVVEEHVAGRETDGRADGIGLNRIKIAGLSANGPGKQKRGRTAPRDGKRIKQVNEQELEDEDDADLGSR